MTTESMSKASKSSSGGDPLTATNRRRHPRLAQECLQSSLGPVLDLSRGGARVLCKQLPEEDELIVTIDDGLGDDPLRLQARVVRREKVGWRKHAVGLEFVGPDEATTRRLISMSATGRFFDPD